MRLDTITVRRTNTSRRRARACKRIAFVELAQTQTMMRAAFTLVAILLPARCQAAAAAGSTSYARWYIGDQGEACDDVCSASSIAEGASLGCDEARTRAADTKQGIQWANKAIEAEGRTSIACATYIDADHLAISPYELPDVAGRADCHFRNPSTTAQSVSTCADRGAVDTGSARRWCCCPASGEDAASMCPTQESDCSQSTVLDPSTRRCLPVPIPPIPCARGRTGVACGQCEVGFYIDDTSGDVCRSCPSPKSIVGVVLILLAIFVAIATVAFILVATVQMAFGRDIKSGAMRSVRFAGWIVSALATQAQIGRTASKAQPSELQRYYHFLQIFELNPNAAAPLACDDGGASTVALLAMLLSIACVTGFVLLGRPRVLRMCDASFCRDAPPSATGEGSEAVEVGANDEEEERSEVIRAPVLGIDAPVLRLAEPKPTASKTLVLFAVAQRTGGTAEKEGIATMLANVDAADEGTVRAAFARSIDDVPASIAAVPPEMVRARLGCAVDVDDAFDSSAPLLLTDLELLARLRASIVRYFAGEDDASARRMVLRCRCEPKKTKTKDAAKAKKKKKSCARTLAILRKCCAGAIFLLHPLVTTVTFRSLHCVQPDSGAMVVAARPRTHCFGPDHTPTFMIALIALCYCVVGFPLVSLLALGSRAQWCSRRRPCCADDEADAAETTGGGKDPGRVSGGLCCRCLCCIRCLRRARVASGTAAPHKSAKAVAWSGWTHSDYKPELFFVRLVFLGSITVLAFANTFFNPALAANGGATGAGAAVLQAIRFALCAAAVVAPCAVVVALLPNKLGSRWKIPLRLIIALNSLAMLLLNGVAWLVEETGGRSSDATVAGAIDACAYVVLALSWLTLASMVLFFILFVVIRGAQLQREHEESAARARERAHLVAQIQAYFARRQAARVLGAWRRLHRPRLQQAQRSRIRVRAKVRTATAVV